GPRNLGQASGSSALQVTPANRPAVIKTISRFMSSASVNVKKGCDRATVPNDNCSDFCSIGGRPHVAHHNPTAAWVYLATIPEFLSENLVFGVQVLDDLLLFTINPSGEDDDKELPRLENEVHGRSDAMGTRLKASSKASHRSMD